MIRKEIEKMLDDLAIVKPSAKTNLTISVADLTPAQLVDILELLAGIIRGVRDGYGVMEEQGCAIGFKGNYPFVSAGFDHQEWDSEDFYGEAFMMSKQQLDDDGGITFYAIPQSLAEWFKTKKTCCEYFREREI